MSIESKINAYVDDFEKAAEGLITYSNKSHQAFEQGIYGCVYAKPSKRLASALAIDREMLIVVSTFTDQQQRTIKFCRHHIDHSYGRLEKTVVVILHLDGDGNNKLKNWGRDQGLAVLPVCVKDGIPNGDDLERALCFELYSHDPFDITGPVSDDSNFFGRRDEAIDLARKLQSGQIRSCLGIRKIGKTSIINRIYREIRENYNCYCVMIDCSRDDVWSLDAAQLLMSISASLEKMRNEGINYINLEMCAQSIAVRDARVALENQVLEFDLPLILLFDEVDYITPGSPTDKRWKGEFNIFWRNLRTVYQESSRRDKTLSLLVGGVSTYWFTVDAIENVENAAMAFVPEEYLSPMPTGATVAMVRRLGRIAGLQFDEQSARKISVVSGNMPYWARKACSFINRHIELSERPCTIDSSRLDRLLEEFVSEDGSALAEVALKHLFGVHPGLWNATLKCHEGLSEEVSDRARRILRRYGVLASDGRTMAGTMIESAIASLVAESKAAPSAEAIVESSNNESSGGLGEWAEELAVLGKRRNLLEKRLRGLVLNFIRFDVMSTGKPNHVRERISASIPTARRTSYAHLNAEELVEKFNWTDLVNLISREWNLFSKFFGDKGAFRQNCDIVNDRFDAHAKAADAADFALYRRALTFLEDRIERFQ